MTSISTFLPDSYTQNPEAFFWPVQRAEIVHVRDQFLKSITQKIRENNTRANLTPYEQYYSIFCLHWTTHVIQFYHFLKAKEQFEKYGKDPHLGGDTGFFRSLLQDQAPDIPHYIKNLCEGFPAPDNPVLAPLRFLRSLLSPNMITQKPTFLIDFKNDIIVNSTGGLISKHAHYTPNPVFYVSRDFWFKPITKPDNINTNAVEELTTLVRQSFGQDAHLFSPLVKEWFTTLFSESLYACDIHIQRLLNSPQTLPKKLWIGSGGVFWDRILKYAVKKNGGHVTTHDHGSGTGHLRSISRTLAECNDCDVFIPFSEDPSLFNEAIVQDYLISNDTPNVSPLLVHSFSKKNLVQKQKKKGKNHILVIPYGPDQNTARFMTTPHDSIKVDFLIRLLKKLKLWGYTVSLKPHPTCPMPLNKTFLDEINVHLLTGSIEDAFHNTDIVLFSNMYTTTFREAFEYNKPIVLIDMHYEDWVPKARRKLEKRCSIVDGTYDRQARIIVNWEAMHTAIQNAPNKQDRSYYETYYTHAS